jgi:hypothetical protein
MRSMVEGAFHKGYPVRKPPSVRPAACHLPASGEDSYSPKARLIRSSVEGSNSCPP